MSKTTHKCQYCLKFFLAYESKNQRFCSISCGLRNSKANPKSHEFVQCLNCRKIFKSHKVCSRKYCSRKCQYVHLTPLLVKNLKTHWFKKGHFPHNKGVIGYTNTGSFKFGHQPFEIKNYKNRCKTGRYNGIFMRSSWEILFAKLLDMNHIEWKYEPQIFKLEKGCYIPDFYLLETDTYVEIKGYMDERSKYKICEFKKLHKLIVLGAGDKNTNRFVTNITSFVLNYIDKGH